MSWVGLLEGERSWFDAQGLARLCNAEAPQLDAENTLVPATPLPRGSMVVETRVSPYDRPQTLLGITTLTGSGFRLSLQAVPGGGIVLVVHRGGQTCHATVNLDTGGRADLLRITYSWDLTAKTGRLCVEQPGTFRIEQRAIETPTALSLQDVDACINDKDARVVSSDVSFLAFSDRIEPIGPTPSLSLDTPVMTDTGYRPVGALQRGDVVQTSTGALVPVLANVQRTVPAVGNFAPIRLRAPYFGLAQDIVTSSTQRLVIGGSRVEYMFGAENVLLPIGHLLHGTAATKGSDLPLATYCQLLLPDHQAILAAGTFVESLDVGRLRRRRDVLRASLLAAYPRALLPEHSRTAYPVLREFDALTLAAQRAA
ncbi:Hint domain-containing protein [Shimia sp.]|uniref:Hint domain-containing protein n=1 Tax=Shimia sp. TaxID=1954381 RepID=UPI003B8BD8DC